VKVDFSFEVECPGPLGARLFFIAERLGKGCCTGSSFVKHHRKPVDYFTALLPAQFENGQGGKIKSQCSGGAHRRASWQSRVGKMICTQWCMQLVKTPTPQIQTFKNASTIVEDS
jgi:hypothetical protein